LKSLGSSSSSSNSESCSNDSSDLSGCRRKFDDLVKDEKRKPCKPYESRTSTSESSSSKSHREPKKKACKKQRDSSASSGKGKKFIVTWGCKDGHQWSEYNDDKDSIHVNGKNGPVLHLYRGCTYFFCVEQPGITEECPEANHCFVLTNSPVGGHSAKPIVGGFAPVSKGCVCFKVDKHTPRYFFYQCSKHEFEGGLVIVHDK
jgi:hypothetical protein